MRQACSILTLTVLLLSSCIGAKATSDFKPKIHPLEAKPKIASCPNLEGRKCITLLLSDWEKYVNELKASCLAHGWSRSECGIKGR